MSRRWPIALGAAIAATLVLASPSSAVMFGIADQKPAMFSDPLFSDLQIRKARIVVPWDVLSQAWQVHDLDAWMTAAHKANVRPLVSFGRSRREGQARRLPSVRRLRREYRRLRARYPFVTEWATWNEANHCSQPTCRRPGLVASYYDMLRRNCRRCTVLGAEVLDQPNMASWVRAFESHAKVRPRVWGLHNYLDANRMRTSGTRTLLANTRGQIWFTETGGIVKRRRSARSTSRSPSRTPGARRAGSSSASCRSASASSASTCTTGIPAGRRRTGTRRCCRPTASRARRSTSCAAS